MQVYATALVQPFILHQFNPISASPSTADDADGMTKNFIGRQ